MPRLLLALLLTLTAFTTVNAQSLDTLRCEYLSDPFGIDSAHPRLSWLMRSDRRGAAQAAYEILVASTPEILAADKGDLWSTGKIASSETAHIEYAGAPLKSRQACWWKVRAWDERGQPTAWSAPAHWEMGLLAPADWSAAWIEARPGATPKTPAGKLAILHATYEAIDGAGSVDVTPILTGLLKNNTLSVRVGNDTLGSDPAEYHSKQLRVAYTLDGAGHEATAPEQSTLTIPSDQPSLHYLRKDFSVGSRIVQARLYATALGLYELHLNGARIGDHLFAPDWTDYGRRCRYQVYDVTSLVKQGENTLAGFIGDGWYSGHIGNGGFQAWGKTPALFAQLEIILGDGTTRTIATDDTWKVHPGPILSSDIMRGENYDARLEIPGWDMPGLDTSAWSPATARKEPARPLDAQVDEPVRETGELPPKSIKASKPGSWICDFGQNLVGFIRIKITAAPGTKITLRHAEVLDADGALYTRNLRGAPAVDTYICKGGGVETWQPRFTYHGFRYLEISGLATAPAADAITAIVVGTGITPAGQFTCSNPALNQLQSNIQWGMRGNYFSVPTDCPQRDERLGWMGDAEVFIPTAAYNGDIAAFFTKWLVDVDDAQSSGGAFTDVSPSPFGGGGTPAWGDAGVICPWTIYLMYGDKRILETHLPAMKRWVDWCAAHSTSFIRDRDRGGDYGDWLAQGEETSHELIGTAYFAHAADIVARACRITGDTAGAEKYAKLFEQIKTAFDRRYVSEKGYLQNGTQTSSCLALRFDLLPENLRPQTAAFLAENVRAHDHHLTTGFLGVGQLLPALSSGRDIGDAYGVLEQDTYPSWLFSVKQGATTIWERWDGWTPDRGFQDSGMNSFNHYSLGSCGEWMFSTLAGIAPDPADPGFRHILIRPRPGGTLTSAEATYDSIRGKITAAWTLEKGLFTLHLIIPPSTTATLTLPTATPKTVKESSKPISAHLEIKSLPPLDGNPQYEIPSGDYHFTCEFQ